MPTELILLIAELEGLFTGAFRYDIYRFVACTVRCWFPVLYDC